MKEISSDILDRIDLDFQGEEAKEVKRLVSNIFSMGLNVGVAQLTRSLLYLSEGDLYKLKTYYMPMMDSDPANVILAAERKAGNPGHFFDIPFDEIEIFFDRMYGDNMEDDPPPSSM
jgi:hypothetical protein